MPEPQDDRARRVVEAIYALFFHRGAWPTFAQLDHHLYRAGEPNTEAVLRSLPEGLVNVSQYGPLTEDHPIQLSVAGLASCADASEDLRVFIAAVRLAADLERSSPDPESKATLSSHDATTALSLPAAGRDMTLCRLGAILRSESWGSSASNGRDGISNWSFQIDRRVRRFVDVADANDYWQRVHETPGASAAPPIASPNQQHDFFISHASEDKASVARPLRAQLTELGYTVWLDEAELTLGDSLRQRIDDGLASCRFGVVILSPHFFAKNWPQYELDGLVTRQMAGRKVILPIWHGVTDADVARFSPTLAGYYAIDTGRGIEPIGRAIRQAAEASGLVSARTDSDAHTDEAPWEYLLFAHELEAGLDRLRRQLDGNELGVVRPATARMDLQEASAAMSAEMHAVSRSSENVERILAPASIERAFGSDDAPGDARRIAFLAEQVCAVLEDLLASAERLRALNVPAEAERLRTLHVDLLQPPIRSIVDYVGAWSALADRLPELIADHTEGEPPTSIEMKLTLATEEGIGAAIGRESARLQSSPLVSGVMRRQPRRR